MIKTTLFVTALLLTAIALGGCNSTRSVATPDNAVADPSLRTSDQMVKNDATDDGNVSYADIIDDLTPELSSTTFRPVDGKSHYHVGANANLRGLRDDWKRFWHIDHPSRLSPYPIMYTSGSPR